MKPERGLQMVVRDGSGGLGEALAFVYGSMVLDQRCLFHKRLNAHWTDKSWWETSHALYFDLWDLNR